MSLLSKTDDAFVMVMVNVSINSEETTEDILDVNLESWGERIIN